MAVVISPLYPVVGEDVTITSSTNAGTITVVEVTSVPSIATLALDILRLDEADAQGQDQGDAGALKTAEQLQNTNITAFDAPGEYGVVVYQIQEIPGIPATVNDRGGERRFRILGTDTGTIHVGAIAELAIATIHGDGASLRLQVNDGTIRAASLVDHANEPSRVAALDAAVVAALAALVGQPIVSVGASLVGATNDLLRNYTAHIADAGVHTVAADTTNDVDYTPAANVEGALFLLNQLRQALTFHLTGGSGAASPWHTDDDFSNIPTTATANNRAAATVLCAELRERVFERHRIAIDSATRVWQVDQSGGPAYADETTDFADAGANDVDPFPAGEAVGDHFAIGFTRPFQSVEITTGTVGTVGTVSWRYWNGTTWDALTNVVDGTSGFTGGVGAPVVVSWDEPRDWVARTLSAGGDLFYIVAQCDSLYTINPILTSGRIMDAHVHDSADTTNALDGPALLDTVVVSYLDALETAIFSAVAGEPEGAHDAAHAFGFTITD